MKKATAVLEQITDYGNMLKAVEAASKGRRYDNEAMRFREDLCENIQGIIDEMREGTYHTGRYREVYITVPQVRLIHVSSFRDRVAQQAIYRVIHPIMEPRYINDSYACRIGKGTHAAADRLQYWLRQISRKPDAKSYTCAKIDAAKFFYRLDHALIMQTIGQYIDDPGALQVIDNIINCKHTPFGLPEGKGCKETAPEERLFDVGVPIGSLMSQTMANMIMNEADHYAKHTLRIHYYIRYMDDIVILAPDKATAHKWMQAIAEYMEGRLKLKCNGKTQIIPLAHGIPFVGRKIWGTHTRLRKRTRQHIKKAVLHKVKQYADCAIEKDAAQRTIACYTGLCKHVSERSLSTWIDENAVLTRPTEAAPQIEN